MHIQERLPIISQIACGALLIAAFLVAACDMGTDAPPDTQVMTYEGQVTDDQGHASPSSSEEAPAAVEAQTGVDGAVVTAAQVDASGTVTPLQGEATTQADGSFSIDVDGAAGASHVVLVAEGEGGFSSAVLVKNNGQAGATVQVPAMNVESKAEANVFTEVRSQEGGAQAEAQTVTLADVILHVDEHVAAEIEAGNTTEASVAADLIAQARAKGSYYGESGDEEDAEEGKERERQATVSLQAQLATSTGAEARAEALRTFSEAVIEAYVEAGVDIETQARARQAGRSAAQALAETSGEAAFRLQKNAETLAALATALAVEALFEAEGAAEADISALVDARGDLMTELRAATSAEAVADAKASYEASVESALETSLEVTVDTIESARASVDSYLDTLLSALGLIGNASLVAEAHVDFYADAESTLRDELEGSANADLGARVLALLVVFSDI